MGFGPKNVQLSNTDKKRDNGTSASGTPGTVIATLTATAGKRFIGIGGVVYQPNALNTQTTVTVTYDDDTTDALATTAATETSLNIDDAGISGSTATTQLRKLFNETKGIKKIEVTTLGAGTGTREASLSAIEVPA